jgi:integrase
MPDPQLLITPAAASRDIAVGAVADRLLAQASTDLVTLLTAVPADDPVAGRARAYVQAAKAPSTQRAYRSDWRDFERWCQRRDLNTLPAEPETVGLYIADLAATHRPATISRRLTAIAKAHQASKLPSPASLDHPEVGETLKGIRRTHGTAQPGKRALLTADLLQVLAHLDSGLLGCRDRALLLAGFSGGLRRSELAALDLEDVAWVAEGAVLTLRRSKTDQQGRGRQVAVPRGSHPATCPIAALKAWLGAARITAGPLFRAVDRHGRAGAAGLHADSVGTIIKRAVSRAGFDPEAFAGHSLRAGFATQAARNGATVFDIMRQTGHRSVQTVARYVREAQIFHDSPAQRLGL